MGDIKETSTMHYWASDYTLVWFVWWSELICVMIRPDLYDDHNWFV